MLQEEDEGEDSFVDIDDILGTRSDQEGRIRGVKLRRGWPGSQPWTTTR